MNHWLYNMQQHKDTYNIEAYYNVLTHTHTHHIINHWHNNYNACLLNYRPNTHTQLQYTTQVMYAIETVIIQQTNHLISAA